MAIQKANGKWLADIRPNGRYGKRYRKSFSTKGEAERWAAWLKAEKTKDKEWEPQRKRDSRRLSDLVESWWTLHGQHLKDGEGRKRQLDRIAIKLGNPFAGEFSTSDFSQYRQARLKAGVSPNTVNHDHAYLRAVFNELERLGEWEGGNPLAKIRRLKVDETELSFLDADQVIDLLTLLDAGEYADAHLVARVCLATGARWSEAETLRTEQVYPTRIDYHGTKSGKRRSVPIGECLYRTLADRGPGRLFRPSYNGFRRAISDLEWELPQGQLTHVLRHTFASHFMQNGGNILALQRILGHASLTMTMRYAHLAPDHLEQARVLNPLS